MASYVRAAEQKDIMEILKLLRMFGKAAAEGSSALKHFSPRAVCSLIAHTILNGVCLVAVDKEEEKIIGVIMGAVTVNPWTDTSRELKEVAWYMDPEYRGDSRVGLKLYRRYVKESNIMLEDGVIFISHMTALAASGESTKRLISKDFKELETHYYRMGGS